MKNEIFFVARRGARLLDEVERSGARRLQTVRAWPLARNSGFEKKLQYKPQKK